MATAAVDKARPERGSDARKAEKQWLTTEPVAEFPDKGLALYPLIEQSDLDEEGKLMHHCSGQHKRQIDSGMHQLYSLRDLETQTSHCTLLLVHIEKGKGKSAYYTNGAYRGVCEQVEIGGEQWLVAQVCCRGTWCYNAEAADKNKEYMDCVLEWLKTHPFESESSGYKARY